MSNYKVLFGVLFGGALLGVRCSGVVVMHFGPLCFLSIMRIFFVMVLVLLLPSSKCANIQTVGKLLLLILILLNQFLYFANLLLLS
jgi:hypothetical protein